MTVTKQMVEDFVEKLESTHEDIIRQSGGEQGVRDMGGLAHAAFEILGAFEKHHNNPFRVAAVIYNLLATRHYFVDGNKRTAHVTAQTWLLSSGYDFKVPYEEAVQFIISIAQEKPIKEIEDWTRENAVKVA